MTGLEIAVQSLEILDLTLRDSRLLVREEVEFSDIDRGKLVTQSFRTPGKIYESELVFEEDGETCLAYNFVYHCGVRVLFEAEVEEANTDEHFLPVLEIVATYKARYRALEQLDDDALTEFSKLNVAFNVWPFWREHVYSSCNKIGLSPVLEVPLLKVKKD